MMLHSVEIRLQGLPSAVEAASNDLRERYRVMDESRVYPNRPPSKLARKYLTLLVATPVVPVTVEREADENRALVARRRRPQLGEGR